MFSTLDDPEHWLWQEQEARSSAASAANSKAREILLRLADDYQKRAQIAQQRRVEEEAYRPGSLFFIEATPPSRPFPLS
jgi:hypothetical protein